jgi:O-antigen/teichoic acid export membrane protein
VGLRTARSGIIYLAVELATSPVSLVILLYLARVLHPDVFGLYAIALAFASLLGMAGNFGMALTLMKKIPEVKMKEEVSELVSNAYYLTGIVALILAIIGIAASGYIAANVYKNASLTLPIMIASISVLFSVLMNTSNGSLFGLGRIKEAAKVNILYTLGQLVLIVALVSAGYGIIGAMSGYLGSVAIGTLSGILYLRSKKGFRFTRPDTNIFNSLSGFSVPIVVSNLVNLGISNFSVLVLGVFATALVVGNYGAALNIGTFITPLINSITYMLLPAFSYILAKKMSQNELQKAFNNSVYYTMLFFLPLLAFIVAAANPIMTLLLSKSYTFAGGYFALIAVGMCIGVIGTYAGTLVIGMGKTGRYMKYQIIVGVCEVILLMILTPYLKAIGTIVAVFIIGSLMSTMLFMYLIGRELRLGLEVSRILRIGISSIIILAIMFPVTYYLNGMIISILVDAIIAVLLYPPLAGLTGAVRKEEITFMKHSTEKIPGVKTLAGGIFAYTEHFIAK